MPLKGASRRVRTTRHLPKTDYKVKEYGLEGAIDSRRRPYRQAGITVKGDLNLLRQIKSTLKTRRLLPGNSR